MADANTLLLSVKIVQGANIKQRHSLGKGSVYAVVSVSFVCLAVTCVFRAQASWGETHVRTESVKGSEKPVWNAETTFWLDKVRQKEFKLAVQVWDVHMSSSHLIGTAYVDGKTVFSAPSSDSKEKHADVWVALDASEAVCVAPCPACLMRVCPCAEEGRGPEQRRARLDHAGCRRPHQHRRRYGRARFASR